MSTVRDSPQAADVPRVAEDAHFPAGTEGQVYYLHSGSLQELKGKCTIYTAENHGIGPTEKKKMVSVSCKTRNPNGKSLVLRSHIER